MQTHEETLRVLYPPVSSWIEAFNAHDVAAIVALYTDDAELFDSGMKYPRRGRDEIIRWFTSRFQTMPSIRYTLTGHTFMQEQGATQAAVTWTTSGHGPRFLGQGWLSRPFRVDGVSVFTLHEGRIQKQRGYYDHLAVLEQVFPPLKWIHLPRL